MAATVAGNLRLASRLNALFWESALPVGPASSGAAIRTPEAAPPTIRVDGRQGELLTIPFVVENRYGHSVEAHFAAERLATTTGPALPSDAISFNPSMATVPPGGELVVEATVAVTDRFVVGAVYATTLRVRELQSPSLRVEISVVPGHPSSADRAGRPSEPCRGPDGYQQATVDPRLAGRRPGHVPTARGRETAIDKPWLLGLDEEIDGIAERIIEAEGRRIDASGRAFRRR